MSHEVRTVCFDPDLKLEACRFEGLLQDFPNHFHDYYVIGFLENGNRCLNCSGRDYSIRAGDLFIFNPQEPHVCRQTGGNAMDYRSLNVKPEIMQKAVFEITGQEYLPRFFPHVLFQSELTACLRELHQRITEEETDFKKEELFLLLIEQLLEECSEAPAASFLPEPSPEIQAVCDYLERHYTQTITLDTLSALAGLSKYHLLRSFTRQKSISPYSYLETVRIGAAKKLLEAGVSPAETAFRTGFSDQSHFSNFFKKLIGLTPRQYMKIFQQEPKTRSEDTQP